MQKLVCHISTTTECKNMRLRMYSESPGRIGRAKKILELRSGKHMPVDTSE
jgi:hypothetical protein